MSESSHAAGGIGGAAEYTGSTPQSRLVRLGGALGIAGAVIGLLIFFAACAGFHAAFMFSVIPLILGVPGLVLTVIGAIVDRHHLPEDTHVMQAAFCNIIAIIGGILEMAVWQGWRLFS